MRSARLSNQLFEPGDVSATPSVLRVRPASPPPTGPGSSGQAALELEPRELWIAAHVPQLSLLALACAAHSAAPLVVLDEARNPRIIDADAKAQAAGVRIGMTLGAAFAAVPHLDAAAARCRRASSRSCSAWPASPPRSRRRCPSKLPMACCSRSSRASACSGVCGSCAGSCAKPASRMRCSRGAALQPRFTLAPTALAALAAARAGARCFITDPSRVAGAAQATAARRAALARRGQRAAAAAWACARSVSSCACRARGSPNVSASRGWPISIACSGGAPIRAAGSCGASVIAGASISIMRSKITSASSQALASVARRARAIPAHAAARHHRAAMPLPSLSRRAHLLHAAAGRTRKRMPNGCSRCCASGSPISRCPSPCGVANCAAARSRERPLASQPLWPAGERGHAPAGEMPALIEHLRARLGADAVYGLRRVPEHRPENALARGRARARASSRRPCGDAPCRCRAVSPAAVAAACAAGARFATRPAAPWRRAASC